MTSSNGLKMTTTPWTLLLFSVVLLQCTTSATAAYDKIVGYQPRSNVADYLIMDEDKRVMENRLSLGELIFARRMYEWGGHSAAIANLTLLAPPGPRSFNAGTIVRGIRREDNTTELVGMLLDDVSWGVNVTSTTIHVRYPTGESAETIRDCKVGGLFTTGEASLDGCKYCLR